MSKKQGVKKTKANHENFVQAAQKEQNAYIEEQKHFTRVAALDIVTIALGRLGFNEDDYAEFDRVMTQVCQDYEELYADDVKDDPDMWYSNDQREKEIRQYVGSRYVPPQVRY